MRKRAAVPPVIVYQTFRLVAVRIAGAAIRIALRAADLAAVDLAVAVSVIVIPVAFRPVIAGTFELLLVIVVAAFDAFTVPFAAVVLLIVELPGIVVAAAFDALPVTITAGTFDDDAIMIVVTRALIRVVVAPWPAIRIVAVAAVIIPLP
jgi:hypothetical protein